MIDKHKTNKCNERVEYEFPLDRFFDELSRNIFRRKIYSNICYYPMFDRASRFTFRLRLAYRNRFQRRIRTGRISQINFNPD